jgi:hypothetical protein
VSEDKVLRTTFGDRREGVAGRWGKVNSESFAINSVLNPIRIIALREIKSALRIAAIKKMKNA